MSQSGREFSEESRYAIRNKIIRGLLSSQRFDHVPGFDVAAGLGIKLRYCAADQRSESEIFQVRIDVILDSLIVSEKSESPQYIRNLVPHSLERHVIEVSGAQSGRLVRSFGKPEHQYTRIRTSPGARISFELPTDSRVVCITPACVSGETSMALHMG